MIVSDTRNWPIYFGSLDFKKTKGTIYYKALCSFYQQVNRCNNPKNRAYKFYGGKGIKVDYSVREFVGWYVFNAQFFTGKIKSVGRISHIKSYSFDNIRIEELVENRTDGCIRAAKNKKGKSEITSRAVKTIARHKNGHLVGIFNTISAASKATGVPANRICKMLTKGFKSKKYPYLFEIDK